MCRRQTLGCVTTDCPPWDSLSPLSGEILIPAPLRTVRSNDSANTGQVLRECQAR